MNAVKLQSDFCELFFPKMCFFYAYMIEKILSIFFVSYVIKKPKFQNLVIKLKYFKSE